MSTRDARGQGYRFCGRWRCCRCCCWWWWRCLWLLLLPRLLRPAAAVAAAAAAVATVIDTGVAFATACAAANYSCCACCCHRWRCCCRPFSLRVLLLLFSWSCLAIHRSPRPALPGTSIASEFEHAASVPSERLRLMCTDRNCGPASAPKALARWR